MRYLQLENMCRRILIWISKTLPENEIFQMYQYVVFVLKDPFYRRKFFLLTRLQNDFILYIIRKNILMIHISTEIFFNVISFVFHFERLISQKKILLIHISPEGYKKGFHPVYRNWIFLKWLIFSQKEIIFLSFCKSKFSYILECRFHFENLYCRRKFLWLTLQQKNLILYMKMKYIIPHYFVSFCRRNLPIFQNVLFRYGQDIIYSTRTLIFQINSKRMSLFFIVPSGEVRKIALIIKIATSAV